MRNCSKCTGSMEQGFVVDQGHGAKYLSSWHAGVPEISKWFGLKTNRKKQIPIESFRCTRCGYLESYAKG